MTKRIFSYDAYFFVIDVETGDVIKGNKKPVDEIALTEIAIVPVHNRTLEILEGKSWLIKPYAPNLIYNPKAAKVSGITKEMCEKEGMSIEDVYAEFIEYITPYVRKKKAYLVGHNMLKFDFHFIYNFLDMMGDDLSEYCQEDIFDTLVLARLKYIQNHSFNLDSCCELLNINNNHEHRALADAKVTAKVFVNYIQCLRNDAIKNFVNKDAPMNRI